MGQGKSALGIVRKYHPNVTKVVEAKADMLIAVTAKDCRGAQKKKPNACALAKACERNYDGALISLTTAYLIKGDQAIRFRVTEAISRELVSFDRHHDFQPGEYKLKRPSKTFRLRPRGDRPLKTARHKPRYSRIKHRNHKTAGLRAL